MKYHNDWYCVQTLTMNATMMNVKKMSYLYKTNQSTRKKVSELTIAYIIDARIISADTTSSIPINYVFDGRPRR